MAVQAQYSSNFLLLNDRSGQEQSNMLAGRGGNYSLQLQEDNILHSQMLYSNGAGVNPRRRVGETIAGAPGTPADLFHLQSQHPPPTLVDLHAQQPAMVSTGLRLAFQEQQQQLGVFLPSSTLSSSLSEELAALIKQQRDEIDQIFQSQREQLRRTLVERRQRHNRFLLAMAEESVARRLREKDAELEAAARRRAELEGRVVQLKEEAQAWQAVARAQEEVAVSLQAQLRQAVMTVGGKGGGGAHDKGEDIGSSAGGESPVDDAESVHVDPGRVVTDSPPCRVCRNRGVSVLLLPCRHLCVCNGCDTTLDTCPVCNCLRTGSVEVYFS